jgi:hypothetical protein
MPQETPSAPVPSGGAERLTLSLEPVRWGSSAAFSKNCPGPRRSQTPRRPGRRRSSGSTWVFRRASLIEGSSSPEPG